MFWTISEHAEVKQENRTISQGLLVWSHAESQQMLESYQFPWIISNMFKHILENVETEAKETHKKSTFRD